MALVRSLTKVLIHFDHLDASLTDLYFSPSISFSCGSGFCLYHQPSVFLMNVVAPSTSILASSSRMRTERALKYFTTSGVFRYWEYQLEPVTKEPTLNLPQ